MIISLLSQKGGVGKSSLARTLTVELTRAGFDTLLADIDSSQITSNKWDKKRRAKIDIEPQVKSEVFATTNQALSKAKDHEILIIDGAPHSTRGTLEAAEYSDLVILPTGSSLDDLEPTITLASELAKSLNREKIVFALYKVTSDSQAREARETIEAYGYKTLAGAVHVKTGYISAFDLGLCSTETKYKQLNEAAKFLIKNVEELVSSKLKTGIAEVS